ncbi:hypothetical protein [Mesorhizobium sp.]|uniref:hypothetical protein n=1 Tax=Mesorhizobium sp. TaxID=1871066 RepID=UPI0025C4F7ED|nr:hypothetical protein [Mesorhizobium sp.]
MICELVATLGLILTTKKAIPQFSELPMHVLSASVKFFDVLGFEVADHLLDKRLDDAPATWPGD